MAVRVLPAEREASGHGKGVVQAPELETNVSPDGVGSVRITLAARAGPLLKTSITKSTRPPVPALAGPYLLTETSVPVAPATTVVLTLAGWFPGFGSFGGGWRRGRSRRAWPLP